MMIKFDPRVIFYTTIIYVIALAYIKTYIQIVVILPFIVFQVKLFTINVNRLKQLFKLSIGMFISVILVNYYLMSRDIEFIVISSFRILSMLLLAGAMVTKMELREIGFVVEKTLSPLKYLNIPIESIGVVTALAFKFIPMLEAEGKRILLAQKARGLDFDLMTIKEKVKNLTNLFFPIIIFGIQNAINLAIAMEVRGYGNGIKRSRLKVYKFQKVDWLYLFFVIISCILFCRFF